MPTTPLKTRDGTNVEVRPLSTGDGPALQQFNAALTDASRGLFLPHAYDDTTIAEIIARSEAGTDHTCIALVGERIIGYGFLWDIQDPVPVLGIGLADAWQGQGLGKGFMDLLIHAAKTAGAAGIELTTTLENERAFALYKKMDFKHIGDTDNIAGDGRTVRERVLFLTLIPGAKPPTRDFAPPV
ncbi:MAG: GNAT family N-acetyltransferase [Candidatus Hydrogenedentes bacterium]|nr:GNAT family N-acetyltransferase [Candidatus Hydrogenedentota bacterium]